MLWFAARNSLRGQVSLTYEVNQETKWYNDILVLKAMSTLDHTTLHQKSNYNNLVQLQGRCQVWFVILQKLVLKALDLEPDTVSFPPWWCHAIKMVDKQHTRRLNSLVIILSASCVNSRGGRSLTASARAIGTFETFSRTYCLVWVVFYNWVLFPFQ